MKHLKIITVPDDILRKSMQPVHVFDSALRELAEAMLATMHEADGVGLAANQVGKDLQLFVYGISEPFTLDGQKIPAVPYQAVVNPVIRILDNATEIFEEGCLSIPGLQGPVARPIKIELSGQDLDGNSFSKVASGYEARVIQHEVDHLHGILFLDHITDPSKLKRIEIEE